MVAPLLGLAAGGMVLGGTLGAAASILGANAGVSAAGEQERLLGLSADFDLLKGQLAQADIGRQARAVTQEQASSYAAQNVDLSSETVSQVREETQLEAARIKNEVELEAAMSAWGKREEGRLGVAAAKNEARAARIGAAGQVLGGASAGAATLFRG